MSQDKETTGRGTPPKNFVVPYVLLLLNQMPVHGYELMHQLTTMGFQTLDPGNFYRIMRQLEKDNYVQSEWDTASGGPAKRLYSLTDLGESYLQTCAGELQRYQSMLGQFFNMYTKMFDLYLSPFRPAERDGEKHNHNSQNQGRISDEPTGKE